MWFFKKKEPKCVHKYKDFPWYITGNISNYGDRSAFHIEIREPYVCIKCGNRIDKTLWQVDYQGRTSEINKKYREKVNSIYESYKDKIKPNPEVEDMINDMILVDRGYLEAYEKIVSI